MRLDRPVSLLVVAVKSYSLEAALDRLAEASSTMPWSCPS